MSKDILIVCHDRKSAVNLYHYILNHFASFNLPIKTDRVSRSFRVLTTKIRVVSDNEYILKCKAGFRGKVVTETEAWRMLDEEKARFLVIKGEKRKPMKYGKLVRDKIPEMIADEGKTVIFRRLSDEEYKEALHRKLDEEVAEFHQSGLMGELVDIMEVINALAGTIGDNTIMDVENARCVKRWNRGGFDKRYFLEEIKDG